MSKYEKFRKKQRDYEDEYYDEDEYLFYVQITRKELETDEEFEKRKQTLEIMKEKSKEKRYQQYLKLKEEFNNE